MPASYEAATLFGKHSHADTTSVRTAAGSALAASGFARWRDGLLRHSFEPDPIWR